MKNSKSFIFGLALVLGVAGGFTTKASKPVRKTDPVFWTFSGTPLQVNDPSKYSYSADDPGCNGSGALCAIQANRSTSNPNQPNLATASGQEYHN
jgi:hypothetical protein